MDIEEIRVGNFVKVNNEKYHSELKDIPVRVIDCTGKLSIMSFIITGILAVLKCFLIKDMDMLVVVAPILIAGWIIIACYIFLVLYYIVKRLKNL